ncbi:MAG: amino-acid N-acetyltransferase [Gammaproteobacteria bacterium]
MDQQRAFVNWFRNSSAYIHAHRNRTFVIFFGGEAVQDANFPNLVHDFALLNSLGIRLVLVHGIRPQIDSNLRRIDVTSKFSNGLRITDDIALQCVKEAAGKVRVEIEALLSLGLTNSPMSGAKITVVSGNFVTAKPVGVIDGIDYGHTGAVRRIDSAGISRQLEKNNVVLLSPVGYSPSGDVFNLGAEQVATETAIALHAEKLILLSEQNCCNPVSGQLLQQMTSAEAQAFLQRYRQISFALHQSLSAAVHACQCGVERVHLLDRNCDGALLLELFTRDGLGTLISSAPFEELRPATLNDIGGILELIAPLEQQGVLKKRSRERLEMDIADYIVIERDGLIIGCSALHAYREQHCGEIACVAVHSDYQKGTRGSRLLENVYNKAKLLGLDTLYVLSTQTMHWFIERGFQAVDIGTLPEILKQNYIPQRNSRALYKKVA